MFELLGVATQTQRHSWIDSTERMNALHTRAIRVVEVQKMEQRRQGGRTERISQFELALDAWQSLEPEWQKPLSEWLQEIARHAKIVSMPEGVVRITEAGNFFEANTIYFGSKPALSQVCASRAEAELLYAIATQGLRGPVSVPMTEQDCVQIAGALEKRLAAARSRFEEVAAVEQARTSFVSGLSIRSTNGLSMAEGIRESICQKSLVRLMWSKCRTSGSVAETNRFVSNRACCQGTFLTSRRKKSSTLASG